MIGHCLGAAGAFEAIATVKAIETGWLHPTINQFVSLSAPPPVSIYYFQLLKLEKKSGRTCMYVSLITKCNLPCKYTKNSL
jgi:3-oxoacyl-(acyl-carrier-protein) synthase